MGCPTIANHGYLFRKDVTASAKVVDKFKTKLTKIRDKSRTRKTMAKRVSDNLASDHVFDRRVHSPSTSNPPLDSNMPPAPIEKNLLLMPNQAATMPTHNRYADLYHSGLEDNLVFEEMVSNDKTVNSINTYSVVPLNTTLARTPTTVLKKKRKRRVRTHLATINRSQSDSTSSARFLSTALHSVSQTITRVHTDKIAPPPVSTLTR